MPHLTARSARTFDVHGVRFTSFASSASGSHDLAAWRADFPPHTIGRSHTMSRDEILHVLLGPLEIAVDDDEFTAVDGDAVLVPAGSAFRVSNTADHAAQAWVTTTVGMTATMLDAGETLAPPWAQ
ncbi:hypothetical protein nbrc107696_13330 [Gordonia spumicola]|uniref:Cupin type-2 domain-containing protein n=1 Tax=Gordonia spumicola TaxID=589161 RepID=A0A7I9V6H7_9ACTN|nr:cupin domain-containing protein [Gordonia spumicola]GEE00887.1 hypothetical protein nbrc107696_13330 [Gordonia spumicola]